MGQRIVVITLLLSICYISSIYGNACSGQCGSSSCCDDQAHGVMCYSSSQYTCVNGNLLCSVGNQACGTSPNQYCYDPSSYSCENGQLVQTGSHSSSSSTPTPTPHPSSSSSGGSSPSPTPTPHPSSTTGASSSNGPCASTHCSPCCDIQTANGLAASCYDSSQYSCFEGVGLCPSGLSACGSYPSIACYNPSQFSCVNGALQQKGSSSGSTPSPTPTPSHPTPTPSHSSSTTGSTTGKTAVQLYGVDYNPRRSDGSCPSLAQVKSDVQALVQISNRVRIYSIDDCNSGLLLIQAIQQLNANLIVTLGIWLDTYHATEFPSEYSALITVIEQVGLEQVEAILVGSETQYRHDFSTAQLITYIQNITTTVHQHGYNNIIVSTADVISNFITNQNLINAVPVIYANQFPFWQGTSVADSVYVLSHTLSNLVAVAKGKEIIFSETGWPSGSNTQTTYENAVAGVTEEQQYLNDVVCYFHNNNINFFWFEAFDEPWKPDTSGLNLAVEGYFGVYNSNRQPKAGISLPIYC